MADGWLKLHRELMDKAIWIQSTAEQKAILMTILMMANHEERQWVWKGQKYVCKPGQFITSLPKLAEAAGKDISVQNVRTALNKFKKLEFLTDESTGEGRLITIANWAKYQSDKPEITDESTGNQQTSNRPLTANKNDNNSIPLKETRTLKSTRKESAPQKHAHGEFKNVKLTDEDYQKLIDERGQSNTDEAIEYLSGYIVEKAYKSKSHYQTLKRWVFNAVEERKRKPPGKVTPMPRYDMDPEQRKEYVDVINWGY